MRKIILFLIAIIFTACTDSGTNSNPEPEAPAPSGKLMPLSVGNTWGFNYTIYYDGNEISKSEQTIAIDSKSAGSDGIDWYYNSAGTGFRNTHETFEMKSATGSFMFPYPAKSGVTKMCLMNGESYTVRVLSTDTTITVPAGVYRCVRYGIGKVYGGKLTEIMSFCPGVGIVHDESTSSSLKGVLELVEYDLK